MKLHEIKIKFKTTEKIRVFDSSVQKALDGTLSLDKQDNRTIYMIARGQKRGFTSAEVFFSLGYQFHQAIPIDLSDYPSGEVIEFVSTSLPGVPGSLPSQGESSKVVPRHPEGALILDKNDNRTVWWILRDSSGSSPQNDMVRMGFESAEVFHTYGFDFSKIVPANDADMSLPAGPLVKFRDGTLVNDNSLGANTYYIISEGRKRRFATPQQLVDLGYSLSNVISGLLTAYVEDSAVE